MQYLSLSVYMAAEVDQINETSIYGLDVEYFLRAWQL